MTIGAPSAWHRLPLSDLLAEPLANGRSVPNGSGQRVLRLSSLHGGVVDLTDSKRGAWTEDDARAFLVQESDILVARGNGSLDLVGRAAVVPNPAQPVAYPDTMIRIRLDPESVNSRYFTQIWNSPALRRQIAGIARTTAGIYKVNQAGLGSIEVPLPPINEQLRIAEALDAAMSVLTKSRQDAAGIRARIRALEASACGALFESATSEGAERAVRDVAVVSGGLQKSPARRAVAGRTTNYLRVANVLRMRLELTDVHTVPVSDKERGRVLLHAGDLLVVEGNGSINELGRAARWLGAPGDWTNQNHLIRVRPGSELLPEYLELVWNSPQVAAQIRAVASSTSGLHTLSTSKVGAIRIPVPPLAVQHDLVVTANAALSAQSHMQTTINRVVRSLDAAEQSLLKAAVEGRLVPQDPNDEPASVLFDRLKAERESAAKRPGRRTVRGRAASAAADGGRKSA